MLMRRWERARQGDGQLVLIVGEPGLGKSRLIEECASPSRHAAHLDRMELLATTAKHAVASNRRMGSPAIWQCRYPVERQLADLESTLALIKIDPAENVPLLAPLLDIPLPKERLPALPPEEVRRRQLAAMTNWVIAGARSQPLVLALEDVHWADPTTVDFIRGIAERRRRRPCSCSSPPDPSSVRPGECARITPRFLLLRLIDHRCRRWWQLSARTRCRSKSSMASPSGRRRATVYRRGDATSLERGEPGGIQAIPPTLQQSLDGAA